MEWSRLTAHEAHEHLIKKSFSSLELTQSLYRRIKAVDSKVAAYLTLTEEEAYEQARQADDRIARGEGVTELMGIPLALKDILCTKSIRTTCASKILSNFSPPYDATVVAKLRESGAVFLGKANIHGVIYGELRIQYHQESMGSQ
jgi:aspartyl-tRNA(Asn)/glutamyl-tRNA(Gln) amidotransferase subunit A